MISGALQPEAAILNAALVPDIFAVNLAAHKALQAAQRQALRSKTLHAELVFGISGSKHVSVKWHCQFRQWSSGNAIGRLAAATCGSLAAICCPCITFTMLAAWAWCSVDAVYGVGSLRVLLLSLAKK